MTNAEPVAAVRARYDKWLWEAAKVIGASSIAAIIALQIGITQHSEKIAAIREEIMEVKRAIEQQNTAASAANNTTGNELRELRELLYRHELDSLREQIPPPRWDSKTRATPK